MANPTISNVALVSRYDRFAVPVATIIDGSGYSADTVLPRGTLLVRASSSQPKWTVAAHSTALAADNVRILMDECRLTALTDAPVAAYIKGFFYVSHIVDANSAGGIIAADLTTAAGFHPVSADEVELK